MNKFLLLAVISIVTLCSQSASAHHSFSATFKADEKTTVEGVITNFSFKNPHVLIHFDVTNDDGTTTEWASEGAAATNMRRQGWGADTFAVGERIRVTGDRTHDGSPMTSIDSVQVLGENGEVAREVTVGAEEPVVAADTGDSTEGGMGGMGGMGGGPNAANFVKAAPMDLTLENGKPNLTGAWSRHGMGLGRPEAPTVTFNETGNKAQALFTEAVDPQVFCDPPGLVRQAGMTPHPVRITQYDDRIEFAWEEYGGSRVVYFDDRDAKGYKTHLGDGIARYEGDALIIETTNLLSDPASPGGQLLSDEAVVTETYKRADSDVFGPVLSIRATATGPWVDGEMVFEGLKMSVGEYEFIETDCEPPLRERTAVHPSTSFFITSVGLGDGANLGGLAGADAHCEALAEELNIGGKEWRAYLSTTGENSVNARDRVGNGPWYNARGEIVASSVENLHSDDNMLSKATGLSERAGVIPGRGDEVNKHDILTGSTQQGIAATSEGDTTCANWTSNSEDGSAIVGHYDRVGGGDNPTSWDDAHASKGCSQENLKSTGGDGLFYCFASIDDTTHIDVDNIIPVVGYTGTQWRPTTPDAPPAVAANAASSASASPAVDAVGEQSDGKSPFMIAGIFAALLIVGVMVFRSNSG
ncbi:DUF6152 family protein [Arenicella sp.]|nr:DUF6152 family protein [Arenicella sp.]